MKQVYLLISTFPSQAPVIKVFKTRKGRDRAWAKKAAFLEKLSPNNYPQPWEYRLDRYTRKVYG